MACFRRAAGVKHGRSQVAQNDGGAAPETDEGKSYRGRDDDFGIRQRRRQPAVL